ncbi:hypothetical protein TNCV_580251 [Trichonephila clavipes]|nr:hypothetical protein TNCV_580251 [Trichonephila clavipes]
MQEEWLNIAPETTRHLVESMPRRLEAVISAKGPVVAYRTSTPQVRGSILGLGKVDSAFDPFSGSINEYQAFLGTKILEVSLLTDHLIGISAPALQCPMVKYTEMGTLGPGPHGLL